MPLVFVDRYGNEVAKGHPDAAFQVEKKELKEFAAHLKAANPEPPQAAKAEESEAEESEAEEKSEEAAPENKAVRSAPENKAAKG